jgi:hypothetical protein|tara:strand:+ start:398 stop:565 length:168 start_codon:yes stop_codon:yes gene_type:complete
MADFCYDCTEEMFGDGEDNDFKGAVGPDHGLCCLCEGCGWITVNSNGKRLKGNDE